jgi:Tol biopolymer transport system component
MSPLTTDAGYEGEPTFAPDGETIAYVSDRSGNLDIFLKQISGGPDINLTNDPSDDAQPAFSPDGKQIAFVSSRASTTQLVYRNPVLLALMGGDIWVMPALGGAPRRIVTGGNFPSWSPDGSEVIYISGPFGDQRIYRVPAIGGNPVEIETRFEKRGAYMAYPSPSKDGRWIAFEVQPDKIFVVPAAGGDPVFVTNGKHPVWDPRTNSIIYSNTSPGTNYSLWQVAFSTAEGKVIGKPEPITVSEGRNMQVAISADGTSIVYAAQTVSFNIESLPIDPESGRTTGAIKELTGGTELKPFFDSSTDGRSIVFESVRGSTSSIWRTDGASRPVQLTSGREYADHRPVYSPDGKSIAFIRSDTKKPGAGEMWIIDGDGANPRFITEIAEVNFLNWLADGSGVFYFSDLEKQLYVYDLATKTTRQVTNEPGVRAGVEVSSDGKWLLFSSTMETGSTDIRAMPVAGGPTFSVVATPKEDSHPSIPISGRWVYFQFDHKNIYRVPGPSQNWRKAQPERITNYPETNLYLEEPQVSDDGRTLVYSHGRIVGDLWLIRVTE